MSDSPSHSQGLTLRLLGEIEVEKAGSVLALPPSKKTRALLAYLAVVGRPQRRDRLCAMFWEIPDDPRGALRWSLTKLRNLLDRPGGHVVADRESVRFDTSGDRVDLFEVRRALAGGIEVADTERLVLLAESFRGEFLEGLDLPACHEFQAWCTAEREDARIARVQILDALVERLAENPERALPYARTLVRIEVAEESFRSRLVSLLARCGRRDEAERQYEIGRRLMMEMGVPATGVLEAAWRSVATPTAAPPTPGPALRGRGADMTDPQDEMPPLIGRAAEIERLAAELEHAAGQRRERVVLLTGEPGVGKSRLLTEFITIARGRGATVLDGCAYEAETGEPYRPWIDALSRLATAVVGSALRDELALLMPVFGEAAAAPSGSRERLFGAIVDLIAARAQGGSVVIVLDDIQWCDDASAALLHYVVRMNRFRPILVALAARDGELADNPSVEAMLRSLRRERLVDDIALLPLTAPDTAELARRVAPDIDAAAVMADSRGNPLFAIELARAASRPRDALPPTIGGLIRDRLSRLPVPAALTLRWAAVLGHSFAVHRLERLPDINPDELVEALETLERHALIRAAGSDAYVFAHDLVRQAVYVDLSGPRRRLMHRRVAEMLLDLTDTDAAASAELVEHAALAGELRTAANGCVAAGRRFLRLFANTEAYAMARRGQHYAAALSEPDRVKLSLELTEIELGARRPGHPDEVARRLEELSERAVDYGCPEHARLGFHMLGHLRWEGGAWSDARRDMLRAEMVSRVADPAEQVVAMAEAARCLVLLERDLGKAESLVLEAGALLRRAGGSSDAVAAASGMLRLYEGQLEAAAVLLEEARELARNKGDRYSEFQALEHLVTVEMQRGAVSEVARCANELRALGDRLRDGSEAPFARALAALLRDRDGSNAGSGDPFDEALEALREADSKHRLAFILTRAAFADLASGEAVRARCRAAEALDCARTLERPSEIALARVALLRAAVMLGDNDGAQREAAVLAQHSGNALSAEARSAIAAVLDEYGPDNNRRSARSHGAGSRRKTVRTADHL